MNKCAQRFKCFLSLTVVYTISDSFPEPCNDPKQNTSLQCVSLQHVTNTTSNVNQHETIISRHTDITRMRMNEQNIKNSLVKYFVKLSKIGYISHHI